MTDYTKRSDDLDGRIHVAQMNYIDTCKAVILCTELSDDGYPCADGFLSHLDDGHWIARKCDCYKRRAESSRELSSLRREWMRQNRGEEREIFPYVGDQLEAKWRAEKKADEHVVENPARMAALKQKAREAMSGMGMEVER